MALKHPGPITTPPDPLLAARLRAWREEAGLSPEEVARKVGVTLNGLWVWETGRLGIPPEKVKELMALYGRAYLN